MSAITGTFTSATTGSTFAPVASVFNNHGDFNISLWGTFVATIQLERTFDNGTTWLPCTRNGSTVTWTAPMTSECEEPEAGVLYRFNCTAYTSGTVNYRISQ